MTSLYWVFVGIACFGVVVFIFSKIGDVIISREEARFDPDLLSHLQSIGIDAHGMTRSGPYIFHLNYRKGGGFFDGRKWSAIEGIKVIGKTIDTVEKLQVDIYRYQRKSSYPYLDYVFPTSGTTGLTNEELKKLRVTYDLPRKSKESLNVTPSWQGELKVAERLNSDTKLTSAIVEKGLQDLIIGFEETRAYVRIPRYEMPTAEQFEVIEQIAKHVKSIW